MITSLVLTAALSVTNPAVVDRSTHGTIECIDAEDLPVCLLMRSSERGFMFHGALWSNQDLYVEIVGEPMSERRQAYFARRRVASSEHVQILEDAFQSALQADVSGALPEDILAQLDIDLEAADADHRQSTNVFPRPSIRLRQILVKRHITEDQDAPSHALALAALEDLNALNASRYRSLFFTSGAQIFSIMEQSNAALGFKETARQLIARRLGNPSSRRGGSEGQVHYFSNVLFGNMAELEFQLQEIATSEDLTGADEVILTSLRMMHVTPGLETLSIQAYARFLESGNIIPHTDSLGLRDMVETHADPVMQRRLATAYEDLAQHSDSRGVYASIEAILLWDRLGETSRANAVMERLSGSDLQLRTPGQMAVPYADLFRIIRQHPQDDPSLYRVTPGVLSDWAQRQGVSIDGYVELARLPGKRQYVVMELDLCASSFTMRHAVNCIAVLDRLAEEETGNVPTPDLVHPEAVASYQAAFTRVSLAVERLSTCGPEQAEAMMRQALSRLADLESVNVRAHERDTIRLSMALLRRDGRLPPVPQIHPLSQLEYFEDNRPSGRLNWPNEQSDSLICASIR